nr:hypothetical protein [Tanacetum cinerariifolium]
MGIRIPQSNVASSVADEAITKEMHDGLGRATTIDSGLEAEQDSGNISKTQTKETPSGPSSSRTSSEGGLGCHVTIGVVLFRIGLKGYLTCPMNHLSKKVTVLENELKSTKAVYNKALITLSKRVKKLEKKLKNKRRRAIVDSLEDEEASLDQEDSLKQGRMIEEIDKDENSLVKERFSSSNPTEDKEIALWVELNRLFEPDEDDELWKFESFELIWRLYDWCGVHHISTRDGHDIFMLVEKEYPLSRGTLLMMLVQKLQVDEHNEMAEELI